MIVNSKTAALIDSFKKRPSSSVLLLGSESAGIDEVSSALVYSLLDADNRHNIHKVAPNEKNIITIDQIRELKQKLQTKIIGKSEVSRIALVRNFETASRESQNALLKLVEEPADKTVLILQSLNKENLLPTITSRCQTIPILPISLVQALEYGKIKDYSESFVRKVYLLSDGQSKRFIDLIGQVSESSPQIDEAKKFINLTKFDRLSQIKNYDKKEQLEYLLEGLERLSIAGLHSSSENSVYQWKSIVKELRQCRKLQQKNVLQKLIFMRLCVQL